MEIKDAIVTMPLSEYEKIKSELDYYDSQLTLQGNQSAFIRWLRDKKAGWSVEEFRTITEEYNNKFKEQKIAYMSN